MAIDPSTLKVELRHDYVCGCFQAMASPCEIFVDCSDLETGQKLTALAAEEALRIEQKFSRFRNDNIVHEINNSAGKRIRTDEETALLLDFSSQCYEMSEGLFDITSGILRRAWKFDGSDKLPEASAVAALLPLIGWDKARWESPYFTLPEGMEIDLGGIGKEYAVDRTVQILAAHSEHNVLVNFGGDLHVSGPRSGERPWHIGIENPSNTGSAIGQIDISLGALTTSGDSRRFLLKDGKRYSHVLDPHTGWPVENAPHSVTVAASNCTEAGILSTLAMLKGSEAESFLDAQDVRYWCQR